MDTSAARVALVTGGAGQLGRHVVARLLEAEHRVHVPLFHGEDTGALRDIVGPTGGLHLYADVDLSSADPVERVVARVAEADGRGPDILLNLAGGFATAPVQETDPDTWTRMWTTNATTAFLCARAVFGGMKSRGWGRIVNVSAFPAIDRGKAGLSAYGAAKAAVLNLTQTLAREGAPHGVTANAILPSIIDTPANREAMPDADTSRWLPPSRIGDVVRFLVSEEAGIVNGSALTLTLGTP